jgi:uncharacterized protein (TIGR03790 family)
MLARRRLTLVSVLTAAFAFGPSALAIDPSDVLVLYNTASTDGLQIANYYHQVHPQVQLLGITGLGTSESISADDYLNIVRPQVLSALTPTTSNLVTTKGMPLLISVTESKPPGNPPTYTDQYGTHQILNWQANSSLESELANVRTVDSYLRMADQSYSWSNHWSNNPYYLHDGPYNPASYNMVLTSRLDGYTVANVTAAIDRAQNAFIGPTNSAGGPYHFLVDNDPSKNYAPSMAGLVNNVLNPAGLPVTYNNTTAFVGTAPGPVIGYDSHGANQSSTPADYMSIGALNIALADGAVFNTWESFNAQSFIPPGQPGSYTGNQGQVGDWLAMGGTAAMGNVAEPGASIWRVANEDQLFQMLIAGMTWGEAAWSSLRQLGYVNTVVGDPLMTWRVLLNGDVNKDGLVDNADLLILSANWGKHVAPGGFGWSQGDLNGDGVVNTADLSLMGKDWGDVSSWALDADPPQSPLSQPAYPNPEPGSLVLLAIGLGMLGAGSAASRRRRARRRSSVVSAN